MTHLAQLLTCLRLPVFTSILTRCGFGCLLLLAGQCATGQSGPANRSAKTDLPIELPDRYAALQRRTNTLARQHNWPLVSTRGLHHQPITLEAVDATGQPIYYTTHSTPTATALRTSALYTGGGLGLSLRGDTPALFSKLGLWDGGQVLTTHQEFGGRVQQTDKLGAISDHATHLAGILVGAGTNSQAQGMAFGARLRVWDYSNDVVELSTTAQTLLLSNHAYGPVVGWLRNPGRPGTDPARQWEWWGNTSVSATEDYMFGFYTDKARDFDRIAYSNPYWLMVRSADNKRAETGPPPGTPYFLRNTSQTSTLARARNDAYDTVPAEATAKNGLTIGAAEVVPNSFSVSAYSGWGPTDDGRIKPDLLGMGTNVLSAVASGPTAYNTLTGTSMASAGVTGTLLLLQELYAREYVGVFMRSATLRGLALHTAARPSPATGPDYRQGWGLLDAEAAARLILNDSRTNLLLERSLTNRATFTQSIVASGREPLVVTISWTDPEGVVWPASSIGLNNRSPRLVNDLDLRISDGRTTSQPWTLDPAQPALAAHRGDNVRDNVEQVRIENPVPGQTYTLTVSHKNTLTYNAQPFSVIVSGLQKPTCTLSVKLATRADTLLCPGQTILLTSPVQQPRTDYVWLRNGLVLEGFADPTFVVGAEGQYALRVTDAVGCVGTSAAVRVQASALMSVKLLPDTARLLLPEGASVRLRTPLVGPSYSYQWYREGTALIGQVANQVLVSTAGSYQVRVQEQGCTGWSPTCLVQQANGNTPLTALSDSTLMYAVDQDLLVFPNPATSSVTAHYRHPGIAEVEVSIIDMNNALRWPVQTVRRTGSEFQFDIPVDGWATGMYIVRIRHGSTIRTARFLKR